jgi:hypothetical protein
MKVGAIDLNCPGVKLPESIGVKSEHHLASISSIFGTDISRARNKFARGRLPCRIVSRVIAKACIEQNLLGTHDA